MKLFSPQVHKKIHLSLLCLIAASVPFYDRINTLFILLGMAHWLLEGNLLEKIVRVYRQRLAVLFLLLFAAYLAGYILSENKAEAWQIIERRASLLALPLLIFGTPLSSHDIQKINFSFSASVLLAFIICFANALLQYSVTNNSSVFFYHSFTSVLGQSAVYMASYSILAIHIVLYYRRLIKRKRYLAVLVALTVFCFMLSSKTMLFILCMGLIIAEYKMRNTRRAVLAVATIVFFMLAVIAAPPLRHRVLEEFESDFSVLHQKHFDYRAHFSGTSLRLIIWKYTVEILSEKNAWLFGVGTGDFQDLLNEKYKQTGIYTGNPELGDRGYLGYGPHNQYLEILFSMGFAVLTLFLYLIIYYASKAVKYDNYFALQVILLYAIFYITESALSVNKGIIPFVFFLLLYHVPSEQKK
jgi:O-antigen ligase